MIWPDGAGSIAPARWGDGKGEGFAVEAAGVAGVGVAGEELLGEGVDRDGGAGEDEEEQEGFHGQVLELRWTEDIFQEINDGGDIAGEAVPFLLEGAQGFAAGDGFLMEQLGSF